jgi:hypothetical protein
MTIEQTITSEASQYVEIDRDEWLSALSDATPEDADEANEAKHAALIAGAESAPAGLVIVSRAQARQVLSF